MQCGDLDDLTKLLRKDGDQILDASSKLSLSASVLSKLNSTFKNIVPEYNGSCPFHVVQEDTFIDLQILYDFIQKTVALKIFSDYGTFANQFVDLRLFTNLKLLEVHRYSLNLVKGLKNLRSQLEFVTCRTSLTNLKEVFQDCGADKAQGHIWGALREAVFSHNNIGDIDDSLEFAPCLNHLDLSYNLIRNVDNLHYLGNLKYLNLANNNVEVLPKFPGQLCNNLQILILRNNYIESIQEIAEMTNLRDLDLGNNSLIELDNLKPLNCLCSLMKLRLVGNPIYYHRDYRMKVCRFLRPDASSLFNLDGRKLCPRELRLVGTSASTMISPLDRSESFNSTITASTIYPATVVDLDFANSYQSDNTVVERNNREQTSDMEVSNNSLETKTTEENDRRFNRILMVGMHDSGFEAGPQRPASPSESIGSAASLHGDATENVSATRKKFSESDIEILSNPSESSIEVLYNNYTPICVQTSLFNQSENADDKKTVEEMHRSL